MESGSQLSKKALKALIQSKISIAISNVANDGERKENVQKAIKKASKLITSKLRENQKAESKKKSKTEPVPKPLSSEEIIFVKAATPGKVDEKKSLKRSKVVKKGAAKIKATRKAVKKPGTIKKAAKKSKFAVTATEKSTLPAT